MYLLAMGLLAKHNVKVVWLWPCARDFSTYTRVTRLLRRPFSDSLNCDRYDRRYTLAQQIRKSFSIPPGTIGLSNYLSADFNITHAVLIQSLDPRLQWPSRWKESDLLGRGDRMTDQARMTFLSRFVHTPLNYHTAQVHIWTKGKYVIHASAEILIRGNLGFWANAASMANMAYHYKSGQERFCMVSGKCTDETLTAEQKQEKQVPTQIRPYQIYYPIYDLTARREQQFQQLKSVKGHIKTENLILHDHGKLQMFKFMLSREKRSLNEDTLEWVEFPEVFQGKAGVYTKSTDQLVPNYTYAEKVFNKIYIPGEEHTPKDMRIS